MRFHCGQFLDLITFGSCPRQMFSELVGLLVGLDGEWLAQGASRDEIALEGFDWDYVFALDHRLPNGTPLEDYRYYVRLGRGLLGWPPVDGTQRGWGRMGF
jgi:hypothetical protein